MELSSGPLPFAERPAAATLALLLAGAIPGDAGAAGAEEAARLEPYLATDFAGLAAQSEDATLPQIVRRRAMRRLAALDPERAPEALVPALFDPAAHRNEFAGELMFVLGRPHSRTADLVRRMEAGRTRTTKEEIIAFARAVSWPGNVAALPVLRRMIAEKWDTAPAARMCVANILDVDRVDALLRLPAYEREPEGHGSVEHAREVPELFRARRDLRANEAILGRPQPRRALERWDGLAVYAVAWPGNRALATAYLKEPRPAPRLAIAAARTRDEECLRRIRAEFERPAAEFLASDPAQRSVPAFGWILTAAVEAADEGMAATLTKLLAAIEEMRIAAQRAPAPGDRYEQRTTDPGGSLRDIIFRGLCVRPHPRAGQILAPYATDDRYAFVGQALLRAGDPAGFESLLRAWSRQPYDEAVAEVFLVYSGVDVLPRGGYGCQEDCVVRAKAWYARVGRSPAARERIAAINRSALADELAERVMLWP